MRRVLSFVASAFLLTSAGAAFAQPGDQEFHDRTLRALERIERALERLERRLDEGGSSEAPPRPQEEIVGATNEVCGALPGNCVREATRYCERQGYARGVAVRIEPRGNFTYLTRVRCFN